MNEKQQNEIGLRLKEVRKTLKVTQKDLAKASGISDSSVCEAELGKQRPSSMLLFYLASVHNVNINFILTGSGNMYEDSIDLSFFDQKEKEKIKEMLELMKESEFIYHSIFAKFSKVRDNIE